MSKLIGYARVSTQDQVLDSQIDALLKAGCAETDIFTDKISGGKSERPGLEKCLKALKKGDTLLVYSLDRLGRSLPHLINTVEKLTEDGINFKSLSENIIDTTIKSPINEAVFGFLAVLAQLQRKMTQERVRAGLAAARARGKQGGRKAILLTDPRVIMAREMHKNHSISIDDICKTIKISRASFYRYLSLKSEQL